MTPLQSFLAVAALLLAIGVAVFTYCVGTWLDAVIKDYRKRTA